MMMNRVGSTPLDIYELTTLIGKFKEANKLISILMICRIEMRRLEEQEKFGGEGKVRCGGSGGWVGIKQRG